MKSSSRSLGVYGLLSTLGSTFCMKSSPFLVMISWVSSSSLVLVDAFPSHKAKNYSYFQPSICDMCLLTVGEGISKPRQKAVRKWEDTDAVLFEAPNCREGSLKTVSSFTKCWTATGIPILLPRMEWQSAGKKTADMAAESTSNSSRPPPYVSLKHVEYPHFQPPAESQTNEKR